MMLAKVKLEWGHKYPLEQQEALRNATLFDKESLRFSEEMTPNCWQEFVVNLECLDNWSGLTLVSKVEIPVSALKDKIDSGQQLIQYNSKVNVSVPGNQLMNINVVKVFKDLCTDMLQDALNEGWQILAICPQPDQRRPDYVMGRVDCNED